MLGLPFNPLVWAYHHLTTQISMPRVDLSGRVCLVTGANQSLGFEACVHLARMDPARIILAVRDTTKGDAAVDRLRRRVPGYTGTTAVYKLDLCSFDSVVESAKAIKDKEERLDIVIENAGTSGVVQRYTSDGYEETLQVNVLSTGLLAVLLLEKLQSTAKSSLSTSFKPRLVIVSSEAHLFAEFEHRHAQQLLPALNDPKRFGRQENYNVSKLLEIFLVRKMATLEQARDVIVTAVNPGLCRSEIRRDFPYLLAVLMKLRLLEYSVINWVSWSSEFGSRNYIVAALSDLDSGSYVSHGRRVPASDFAESQPGYEAQERLWQELVQLWRSLAGGHYISA